MLINIRSTIFTGIKHEYAGVLNGDMDICSEPI